jgi:CxxC-x17-CxxC domain-containing protein
LTQFRHSYIPVNHIAASQAEILLPHWWQTEERTINGILIYPPGMTFLEANGPRELNMAYTEAAQALETITHESEYQDRPIRCVDCNENFIWTAGEQVFFHDKGLKNEPKRCKPCKQAKNERLAAIAAAQSSGVRQRIEVSVQCAQCGQQTTVPFYPSQGRPVYCRSCFLAGRSSNGDGAQM